MLSRQMIFICGGGVIRLLFALYYIKNWFLFVFMRLFKLLVRFVSILTKVSLFYSHYMYYQNSAYHAFYQNSAFVRVYAFISTFGSFCKYSDRSQPFLFALYVLSKFCLLCVLSKFCLLCVIKSVYFNFWIVFVYFTKCRPVGMSINTRKTWYTSSK